MTMTQEQMVKINADKALSASAGAGKTHALVSEYIGELSKRGENGYTRVEQLVAITFTDKAAAEMRERAREELAKKIKQLRSETRMAGSSANLPEDTENRNTDEELLAHLTRQRQSVHGAYISTIHSFCARLLRENPVTAGVDPSFRVLDESEASAMLERSARNVILGRVRNGDEQTALLIKNLGFESMGERAPGLKSYVSSMTPLMRAANLSPKGLLKKYDTLSREVEQNAKDAAQELLSMKEEMLSQSKSRNTHKLAMEMEARPELFKPGEKTLEQAMELDGWADRVKPSNTSTPYGALAFKASELLRRIAGPAMESAVADSAHAFISLLEETLSEYTAEKESISSLDYDDLQEKARDFLRNDPAVAKAVSGRFTRVLVDEFQDINDLQQEIITLIAPPGEGKLFIVGDVKQAIYGFRGANVEVFQRLASEIGKRGGEVSSLNENRRSTPSLIEYTNSFFTRLMRGDDGAFRFDEKTDGLVAIRDGAGISSFVKRVKTSIENGKSEENRLLEARALAREIKNMVSGGFIVEGEAGRRPAGYGDFALLLRTFSQLNIYENAFRFADVPFQVVRGKGFYHSQEVRDFINLLRLLDYSGDTLSLMSVLRSPLVGLNDTTLLRLSRAEDGSRLDPRNFLRDTSAIPAGLDAEEKRRLKNFINRFHRWKKSRDRMMISELIETVLSETGYGVVMMSRFQGEQRLANLFKLIELSRQYESDGRRGFKGFVSRLTKMEETPPKEAQADMTGAEGAVKIMTVHQSKGLEFPVVILGNLGAGKQNSAGRIVFHHDMGIGLKLYNQNTGQWHDSPVFQKIKQRREDDEREESRRLLYVAMTRARDALILSGASSSKGEWAKWIDEILDQDGLGAEIIEVKDVPEDKTSHAGNESPPLAKRILKGFRPEPPKERKAIPELPSIPDLYLSVTALATVRHCPRLYYYQNVMELPDAPVGAGMASGMTGMSAASLGARIHTLLEKAPLGTGAPKDAFDRLVEEELSDMDEKSRLEALENIKRAFASSPLSKLAEIHPEAILREVPLALRITENDIAVTLTGAADLIWFDGKQWSVVDYKYSERPADEIRYIFQLKLYAYTLLKAQEAKRLSLALVYLKEKDNPVSDITASAADLPGMRKSALDAARTIARLEGAPEDKWPVREKDFCDKARCLFHGRCYPKNR